MTTQVTDMAGREWNLTLTLDNVRLIKRDLGIDLGDVSEHGGFVAISDDREKLGRVFWYLIESQAERLGVTEDELATAIDGGVLDQTTVAIREAYINFCPPHQRGAMARMFRRVDELAEQAANQAAEMIESDEVTQMVKQEVKKRARRKKS